MSEFSLPTDIRLPDFADPKSVGKWYLFLESQYGSGYAKKCLTVIWDRCSIRVRQEMGGDENGTMSEIHNAVTSNDVKLPDVQWAVVCTGFVTPEYTVMPIVDDKGRKMPVVIRLFNDRATADKMLKRLQMKAGKVSNFGNTDWTATLPIYGITATDLPSGARRQKPVASETEKGTAGTNRPGRKFKLR